MSEDIRKIYEETKDQHVGEGAMNVGDYRAKLREKMAQKSGNKQKVTMRLDVDIVESLKELAGKGSYQSLANTLLREALESGPLDSPLARLEALAARMEGTPRMTLHGIAQTECAIVFKFQGRERGPIEEVIRRCGVTFSFRFIAMGPCDQDHGRSAVVLSHQHLKEMFDVLSTLAEENDGLEILSILMPERESMPRVHAR